MNGEYKIINAEHIIEPRNPNRPALDPVALQELADSIRTIGLQEPLIVRPTGDKFEVVAGHRRFRACLNAGIINIPCIIRDLSDDQAEDVKAHENLFRQDLDPVEEAVYLRRLLATPGADVSSIAHRLKRSVSWVNDRLAILTYPDYIVLPLSAGEISLGVARALAAIGDEDYRKEYVNQAIVNRMPVWQAEHLLALWDAGALKPVAQMRPPEREEVPQFQQKRVVMCPACDQPGSLEDMVSVFVHRQCPPKNETPSEAPPKT